MKQKMLLCLLLICTMSFFACKEESTQMPSALSTQQDQQTVIKLTAQDIAEIEQDEKLSTLEGAILAENEKAVAYLLKEKHADPNQKTAGGEPVLVMASRRHFADAVALLVEAGADVNAQDQYGDTPLVAQYSDVEDAFVTEKTDSVRVMQILLDAGADVNRPGPIGKGWTALMRASYIGNVKDVKKLLAAGADVNKKDEEGGTALDWACVCRYDGDEGNDFFADGQKRRKEIIGLLLAAGAKYKEEALIAAIGEGCPSLAETLLASGINTKGEMGEKLLRVASRAGMREMVKMLLADGANVNAADEAGDTPLLHAVMPNGIGISDDKEGTVKVLLDAGADVNAKNNANRTPLFFATMVGHKDIVGLLLAAGADVNVQDEDGRTALMGVIWDENEELVKILLSAGADVNVKNKDGETALKLAREENNKKIIKLLKEAGAKEEIVKSEAETEPWTSKKLTQVEFMDQQLLDAAREGDYKTVKNLIEVNADVNAKDKDGNTPLKLAQKAGNKKIIKLLKAAGAEE